ncbi:AvaB protein [Viridothelium virens]|uniref:AvaB protein n=1 Tax=Viridothelium virens TaxID=1048519 RepID=A0A6A6HEE9_VIRVR|nr:AvaB protein [Viridothelium virens]
MLSAFQARPIIEFKQRDKSKIESILAYGDRVLVGLQTGSLRIYRVNETEEDHTSPTYSNGEPPEEQNAKHRAVDLLREEEKFSKRPIQQLAIIKEANILVSLSDNYVSIHDLQSFTLQERLERTKGATSFAVTSNIVNDPSTGIPSIVSRLAVAVKRRIMLWSWQDIELSPDVTEMTLVAAIKSLTWATGTKLIAGMDPGFVMVDIESHQVTDINRSSTTGEANGQIGARFGAVNSSGMSYVGMGGWIPKPMATKLSEDQLLLAKDVNTLFTNTHGEASTKRQVPWAFVPEAIGYSYPYLLALQQPSKGILEVRNPETLSLLQTISLPSATLLYVPAPNISLAHAAKGFLVASDRCIWRMQALGYDSQIEELVEKSRFDEAISLLDMLEDTLVEDKAGQKRDILIRQAQFHFDRRHYRKALELFRDAPAPPKRVISLYPRSIAGDLSKIEEKDDEESEAEREEKAADSSLIDSKTTDARSTPSRSMLGRFRAEKADSDTASIRSSLRKGDSDAVSIKGKVTETVPDKPLEGKDLMVAINELCSFLVQRRTQVNDFLNRDGSLKTPLVDSKGGQGGKSLPDFNFLLDHSSEETNIDWEQKLRDTACLVDTTLFRAYILAKPSLVGSLVRLDNFLDPPVVRDKLYEMGRYIELIDFLYQKKRHKEALELLAKFGKNVEEEHLSKEIPSALRGPRRTVAYLQQLPPEMIDTILQYAEWPLRTDSALGMEVFLAESENAEELPRHRVLDYLQHIQQPLAVQYLEHIISELNDLTPDIHQRLIELYLEQLKAAPGLPTHLVDPKQRSHVQEKLQTFLRSSTQYNKFRTFQQLPTDNPTFHESRALVLRAMGQHQKALSIYVFDLASPEKAEAYCNDIYLSSLPTHKTPSSPATPSPNATDRGDPSIYHLLLSLYLTPPPPHKPSWPPALDLLSRHGARLPASRVLDLVPSTLPIRELERYFRGRLQAGKAEAAEVGVASGLWGVWKAREDRELRIGGDGEREKGGLSRRVVIREEDHCRVCHKRFGGSAIRVYPDGEVVHYGCFDRGKGGEGEREVRRGW